MSSRPSVPKGRITSSAMRHNNSPIVCRDRVTPFVGIVHIRIREIPFLAVILFTLLKPSPLYLTPHRPDDGEAVAATERRFRSEYHLPLEEPSGQRSPHHHRCQPRSEQPGAREPGAVNYPAVDSDHYQFQANQVC